MSSFPMVRKETPIMFLLIWLYSNLGGAKEHYLVQNGISAIGYVGYSFGMVKVVGGGHGLNTTL